MPSRKSVDTTSRQIQEGDTRSRDSHKVNQSDCQFVSLASVSGLASSAKIAVLSVPFTRHSAILPGWNRLTSSVRRHSPAQIRCDDALGTWASSKLQGRRYPIGSAASIACTVACIGLALLMGQEAGQWKYDFIEKVDGGDARRRYAYLTVIGLSGR